jgi:hypothetical protein
LNRCLGPFRNICSLFQFSRRAIAPFPAVQAERRSEIYEARLDIYCSNHFPGEGRSRTHILGLRSSSCLIGRLFQIRRIIAFLEYIQYAHISGCSSTFDMLHSSPQSL